MSRSRWGPLRHSNSMATAYCTPPEFHWWTARVPLNLVYPSSAEFTRASSPVGTRRTTNRQIDVPAVRHVRRNITVKPAMCPKTEMRRAAMYFAQWLEICTCLHVDITDEVRLATSLYLTFDSSCGRLTLLCLLIEESTFLLHICLIKYSAAMCATFHACQYCEKNFCNKNEFSRPNFSWVKFVCLWNCDWWPKTECK